MQYKINMNKTRQAVETVNFRLYLKIIIRQNETQYFTYSMYTEQERENTASRHRKMRRNIFIFTIKQALTQLVRMIFGSKLV